MTRCQYLYRLQEEQAFLYFHLKPMDEKQHSKWINHIFYLIKQSANQVFDDHEAQLKAKDEEITELNHTVSGLNEMYLEAKEEIERLKAELNSAFIRDLKSIKMSSNVKHATWGMLRVEHTYCKRT